MIIPGKVTSIDPGGATIRVPFTAAMVQKECSEAMVFLPDGRKITPEQRRKAWALVGEIAAWGGYQSREREQLNADLKRKFLLERMDELTAKAIRTFSLGDVDIETASMYITFLIDFVLEHNVPTKQPLIELCDDIQAAVYSATVHKRCIVCGKPATLHHVDRVGMGNNRDDICHVGMRAQPHCWPSGQDGHHPEIHRIGDQAFLDKYHLEPIVIDDKIASLYRLGRRKRM